MLFSINLLTKYVIIIYELGSVHENKFRVAPKAKFQSGLGGKNASAVPN